MKHMKILLTVVFALSLTVSAYAQRTTRPVKPAAKEQTLDEKIKGDIADFKGKVWIYAKNLDTGKEYALRADEQTRTASTIKLAIMAEAFRQVAGGKVKWDDSIELTKEKKQGGSGILFE